MGKDAQHVWTLDDVPFDPWVAYHDDGAERTDGPPASSFQSNRAVHLTWDNLSYAVDVGKGGCLPGSREVTQKTILHQVYGEVRPGQILAIMGSSGAGKTTLLNMLAGRTTSRNYHVTGDIKINGLKRTPHVFKRIAAYVEQEDRMFGELTVEEQIRFSAYMRLPKSMSEDEKQERVERTIQELGLSKVRGSLIGNQIVRGVSGGEKKRVNVGTELVTDPSLLFLDEPTTGLDSFNALNMMDTLRRLASAGRTVVTTIHQPRSNIFQLFDVLCLLSEGRLVYFGPASDAVAYFTALSFRCPSQFNPADYFVDLLSIDPRSEDLERRSRNRVALLGDKCLEALAENPVVTQFGESQLAENREAMQELETAVKFQRSWPNEFGGLLRRNFKLISREKASTIARTAQTVIFSLLLGIIWLDVGRDQSLQGKERTQALSGVLFFIAVNQAFEGSFSVLFQYPLERAVIMRERACGMYRVSSYLLSKTVSELPRTFVFTLFFAVVTYWMIGLRANTGAFFYFLLIIFLVCMIAEAATLCISTIIPDPQASAALVPVFIIVSMLFGGFFIAGANIPGAVAWIKWISFIFYAFNGLLQNQLEGDQATVENLGLPVSRATCVLALLGMVLFFRGLLYVILRLTGPKFSLVESSSTE